MNKNMTNIDDIFERGNATDLGEFFAFKNVGDRIAGTYVDLLEGVDGYGNDQYIVVLRREGTNHRVAIKKAHEFLVDKLRAVRLGQIVGFSFDEERPNQGRAATKIINLKQDPSMVDEAWIQEKLKQASLYGLSAEVALKPELFRDGAPAGSTSDSAPAPASTGATSTPETVAATPAVPEATVETATAASPVSSELLTTMKTLIVNKGILTDAATDEEVKAKIEEISELPLTAENGPAIINKIATAGF